jgi:anti-sigma regulatory factor (Ser/Thr protein kinase)/CheY-like chemotaxis protein
MPPSLVKTALVVGSDEKVVEAVNKVLPSWEIELAPTNRAALEMLRIRSYDLVLTGAETSAQEDVELLRRIRIVRPHVRLIVITSQSTPGDVIAAMREGAFSYFSEPYSMDALQQIVLLAATGPVWDEGIEVISATPQLIHLSVRCERRTADRLLQFIHEIPDLASEEREAIGIAFREMLMNAMEHGANFNATQHVEISYVRAKQMVLARVKDPGDGFPVDEVRSAADTDPVQLQKKREEQGLRPGGFGILLSQKVIDELIYGEKGNEVVLIKYLKPATH